MLYVIGKLIASLASPTNLLAVVVLIGAWAGFQRGPRVLRWPGRALGLVFLLCGFGPVGPLLTLPLENRFPSPGPARWTGSSCWGARSTRTRAWRGDTSL